MTSSAAEEPDLRLKTLEVARFVSQEFLRFDLLVPEPLNERFMKEAEQGPPVGGPAGTPLSETDRGSVMAEILRLPKVTAVIQSLVGPDCLFDHQGTRFMLKIRMNPTVRQVRLWNTRDLTPEMAQAQVIFDFGKPYDPNDLQQVPCQPQPWFEFNTGRLEYINRIKLWRHLLGDDAFDAHHWMTRIENEPV